MADAGRGDRATASSSTIVLNSEERADEFLLMGLRLPRASIPRATPRCRAAPSIRGRIAILRDEGAIIVDANGTAAVTQAGFPVLDAVVADLAA